MVIEHNFDPIPHISLQISKYYNKSKFLKFILLYIHKLLKLFNLNIAVWNTD